MADTKAIVLLPAIFTKMTPRKDKSWKLEIETRELQGDEVRIMAERLGTEGYWANSPNSDIEATDVPDTAADAGLEGKSPSQRLRSVIFVLWKQKGGKGDFDSYYRMSLERLIDYIKAELQEEK